MQFEMNPGWEETVAQMAFEATSQRFQPILDGVHTEFADQPIDVIKPVLAARWAKGGEDASISDPELTNIATAISEGRRVILTNGGFTS
jgi:hypothetical protein